jgi:endoglucanase
MKKIIPFILILIMSQSILQAIDPRAGFEFNRGVNISHWLSQVVESDQPMPSRKDLFTELDVIFLKQAGFDHMRLPVDEKELWDEQGNKIPEAFAHLNSAIQWAERAELRVILDLHIVRSHHFNAENEGGHNTLFEDEAAQAYFLRLWDDLMDEVGSYPVNLLAYEIMNEPVAKDPEDWNKLILRCYNRVREREPNRVLIFGANMWQIIDNLEVLSVPENDPDIVLSFHFYEPMPVTHYKASWTPIRAYDGPIQYPGKAIRDEDLKGKDFDKKFYDVLPIYNPDFTEDYLNQRMEKAMKVAKEKGLRLYCGEWGCYIQTPRDIRLAWYRDMVKAFDHYGIAWTIWDYKGGFQIVNPFTHKVDWELIHILNDK